MTQEPIFTDVTEDLWARQPEVYATEDAKRDWQFKSYFSSLGDRLGEVDGLLDRIDYDTISDGGDPSDTSDLADASTADTDWFPWIGMVRGIRYDASLPLPQTRNLLRTNTAYLLGNVDSIIAVVQTLLIGQKFVQVYRHTTDSSPVGAATCWDLLIVTDAAENDTGFMPDPSDPDYLITGEDPDPGDPDYLSVPSTLADPEDNDYVLLVSVDVTSGYIIDKVLKANVKPAGVVLHHKFTNAATWDDIEAAYPTWNAWEAHYWDQVERAEV